MPSAVTTARFEQSLPIRRQRSPEEFQSAVAMAVEEIKAGEAFQIVVSQRFEVDTTADALDVYRVLRLLNPSPYMYLLRMDGFDIVGSSPEALVTVKGDVAITHPIAGSKPRGATPAEDAALETELLADPKERAEHVMLVDLGRNDLGRVCRPGTVEVVEFMDVRRYSHIMHLESTVTGTIADGRSALDVVLAAFPAGTLSGAPEGPGDGDHRRTGGLPPWSLRRGGGLPGLRRRRRRGDRHPDRGDPRRVAYVQAGGGIVADSHPPTEDQETQNKAAAVVQAISVAQSFRPRNGRPMSAERARGVAGAARPGTGRGAGLALAAASLSERGGGPGARRWRPRPAACSFWCSAASAAGFSAACWCCWPGG